MLRLVVFSSLAGLLLAQLREDFLILICSECDKTPVGDEIVESAVPIKEFFTSGKVSVQCCCGLDHSGLRALLLVRRSLQGAHLHHRHDALPTLRQQGDR